MTEPLELDLRVETGPDAHDEELADLTAMLRRQLLDLDVESVEAPAGGAPPEGSKAIEMVAIGALIVKLVGAGGLPAVVDSIRAWLSGHRQRSVKVTLGGDTLEVTGVSSEEQQRLIDTWIANHAHP